MQCLAATRTASPRTILPANQYSRNTLTKIKTTSEQLEHRHYRAAIAYYVIAPCISLRILQDAKGAVVAVLTIAGWRREQCNFLRSMDAGGFNGSEKRFADRALPRVQ